MSLLNFLRRRRLILTLSLGLFMAACSTGCQLSQTVPTARLIQHQAMVDPSGLKETQVNEDVKVHIAAPEKWEQLAPKKQSVLTDMQWRSPSKMTGVGVAYLRLPIPIPAKAIAWLAHKEYSKKANDGKMLGQWQDSLGRPWFEAENSNYHVRGYIVSRGFEAWIIYCGYKTAEPPSASELGIAARSLETIVPTPYAKDLPTRPIATAE